MMRAPGIFCRAMLAGAGLLLVAGCAGGSSTPSVAAADPPLPPAAGVPTPSPEPAPSPKPTPAPVVTPPPAPTEEPTAPLQSSSGAPVTTSSDDSGSSDTATAFDNVNLVNASLASKLAVIRAGSNRTEANLLTVFVGLKNKTAHPLEIEVQTIYKDKSGQPLSQGEANWIPMKLKPHEAADYRSVAISEEAADFLVRIRRAQPQDSTGNAP